jgi:hypothetical protein
MKKYSKEHTPLEAVCARNVMICIVIMVGKLYVYLLSLATITN